MLNGKKIKKENMGIYIKIQKIKALSEEFLYSIETEAFGASKFYALLNPIQKKAKFYKTQNLELLLGKIHFDSKKIENMVSIPLESTMELQLLSQKHLKKMKCLWARWLCRMTALSEKGIIKRKRCPTRRLTRK